VLDINKKTIYICQRNDSISTKKGHHISQQKGQHISKEKGKHISQERLRISLLGEAVYQSCKGQQSNTQAMHGIFHSAGQ
jgi:hypothetical protein